MSQQVFAPGARVEIRDEEWIVRSAKADASGGQAVTVDGVSELVLGKTAIFLSTLDDIRVMDPKETDLVPDTSPRYANTRLYLESLFRRSPATDASIRLGHLAAIDPVPYQLRPAQRALELLRPRFLMADGVGLGKTIEVGVLLTELIRRGRARRILVVAMKSILAQFQEELWGRFTIPLVRLDSVGIQRVQAKIPSSTNPFHFFDRVIVSVDTLKNDVKYRQYLENCRWDVIVIDECQNVAMRTKGGGSRGSQRAQLAQLLARKTDALILTSATPHDGSPESFASLIRLLEPTAIADETDFGKEEVCDYYQRKFKKDIAHEIRDHFPEREMHAAQVPASEAEDAFFAAWAGTEFRTVGGKRKKGGMLFRTTLLKEFLSSPQACLSTIENRRKHQDMNLEELEGEAAEAARADHATLDRLAAHAERVAEEGTPKYRKLVERATAALAEEGNTARIVVFSERIRTLEHLAASLSRDLGLRYEEGGEENQIEIFHGSLDDQSQMALVKSFGSEDSSIRVLLASDAAAEGINLHYSCHHLIHFDLPWSLITLVQRNGRIDRYGQRQTPRIDYLITVPGVEAVRGDLRVLDRLMEKEEQVQKNLGDSAWLMNLHEVELEEAEVARAVEGEATAEEVLPDEPRKDESAAWFENLFGGESEPDDPPVDLPERDSLFDHDLDFAREALHLAELEEGKLVWRDEAQAFDLAPPPDLEHRYEYLPPELTRGKKRFRLTQDRQKVQRAIDLARQKEGDWPEWELFWPQHPVCEWLDDKVLSALGRHQAWVIRVQEGLEPDDALFFFQGVISNQHGQSVLVDWFAIPFRGGRAGDPIDRETTLGRSGLRTVAGNPGAFEVPRKLFSLRKSAVEQAEAHMKLLRHRRAAEISAPLREGMRALQAWRAKSLEVVQKQLFDGLGSDGPGRARARRRQEEKNEEIEKVFQERYQWIERLSTGETPYLRLAAVFIRPDFQ